MRSRHHTLALLLILVQISTHLKWSPGPTGVEGWSLSPSSSSSSPSSAEAESLDMMSESAEFVVDNRNEVGGEPEVQIEEVLDGEAPDPTTVTTKEKRKSPILEIDISGNDEEIDDNTAVAKVYENVGEDGSTNATENSTKSVAANVNTTVTCIQRDLDINEIPSVEIVNATILHSDVLWMNTSIKTRSIPSNCSVVLFFAHWCPFSAKAAPHFNALARAFPHIRVVALDSTVHTSVNSFFGILSVPTILLFHNGKTVAKFNETSFTLNKFADFIHVFTDLKSDENINVTSQDFLGPLPSTPSETRDVWLYLAWIFIIVCFFHYASKSTLWRRVSELVRTTWREAEAQHEHTD